MPTDTESKGMAAVLQEKWDPILNVDGVEKIADRHRRLVTAQLLENTETVQLQEAGPTNQTAGVQNFDPVLINLIRRAAPNLIAYDLTGVQPMTGPTGLIFALRAHMGAQPDPTAVDSNGNVRDQWAAAGKADNELFKDAAPTGSTGSGTGTAAPGYPNYTVGTGVSTGTGEAFGATGGTAFNEVSFTIEKTSVTAKTRALKAEYTMELQQDLKAIHGLDAETELSNILSTEILAEINREVVETVRRVAKVGAAEKTFSNGALVEDSNGPVLGTAGVWDLEVNTDGRWQAEKMKSLLFKIGKEANAIAKDTRRGRGNFIVVSSDVATALDLAGKIDYAPAVDNNLNADDTGVTYLGMLQGRYRVYIDPYLTYDEVLVGYKGSNAFDAGLFYCPYVPLQMVKAVGENTFQPKMAFKTRYGMVANPFTTLNLHGNSYFRKFRVVNL